MLGAFIAGGASLLGGAYQAYAAKKEAEKNRNFQADMSNTAHQREVLDLKKAGLNPILSATGGASTPSGSMAQIQDMLSPAVSSALEARRLDKDIKETDSRISLNEAQKAAAEASSNLSNTSAKKVAADINVIESTLPAIKESAKTQTLQERYNQRFIDLDNINKRIQQGLGTINSAADLIKPLRHQRPDLFQKTKDGDIYNKNTGEIYEKFRRP